MYIFTKIKKIYIYHWLKIDFIIFKVIKQKSKVYFFSIYKNLYPELFYLFKKKY